MQQKASGRQDGLQEYVENLSTLRRKIEGVRERQQAALEALLAIRQRCQALRLALSRSSG